MSPEARSQSLDLPLLSVVIPSRDRCRRLAETLTALGEQEDSDRFEVIVVDDGSTDETARWLAANHSFPFATFAALRQPHLGPAAARNLGISHACAPRIWLLGDDTRPAPGAASEHLDIGRSDVGGTAVQGHIDWDPKLEISDVMRFLAPEGPQFFFKGLVDRATIPYTAVLGSNLCAPRAWFLDQPYDERFRHAAVEDTELAYRWQKLDRRVVYSSNAVCWHHHHYADLEPFLRRQQIAGGAARIAAVLRPGMIPRVLIQPLLYGKLVFLRHLARLALGRSRREDLWDLRCRAAFFMGVLGFAPAKIG